MSFITKAIAPVHHIDDDANSITITGSMGGGIVGSGSVSVSAGGVGSNGFTTVAAGSSSVNGFYTFPSNTQRPNELLSLDLIMSQEADLPDVVFVSHDFDSKKITMTLKPEPTISTLEALKITMLINASTRTPTKFSVFAYIKKNNLERHFKFVQ